MKSWLFLALLWSLGVSSWADTLSDLQLIQARPALPMLDLWLDIPSANGPKPEQFVVSLGSQTVDVEAIDGFTQTGEGVAYIFLVDVSKSLSAQQFSQIQSALRQWLTGMGERDRAALLSFGSEVKQRVAFSDDRNALRAVVDGLALSDQQTQFYRALLEAIRLGRLQESDLPARRAIIVLSDGIDDALNGVTLDDIHKQSQEYRVPIYGIGFAKPPLDDRKREGLKVLASLSRQSGGRFVQAEAGQLERAYEQQHQHITQAYRLRLRCSDCVADGQLRRLNVTWNEGGAIVSDGMDIRVLPPVTQTPERVESDYMLVLWASFAGLSSVGVWFWIDRRRRARRIADENAFEFIEASHRLAQLESANARRKGVSLRLTVVTGHDKGQTHKLDVVDSVLLGRAPNCDLCIVEDSEISSQHALLKLREGRIWVRDLNSTNGTWVNGVPIHNEYPLRNDDLLLLGRTELRVAGLR